MKRLLLSLLGMVLAVQFSTAQALLTVTAPNGGESLTACDQLTVSYTKSAAASDHQRIEVSFNSGRTYFEVTDIMTTGSLTGQVVIPVPNRPSTRTRVRVREYTGGTNQSDASDADFSIGLAGSVPPFFITAPSGVDTFAVASTQRITWSGPTDRVYRVSVSVSTTSGFQTLGLVSGRNYYDWNIANQSTRMYLRVQDTLEPCRVAYSDTLFRSLSSLQGIGLTTFNGGEVVQAGDNYTVRWNTNGITQDTMVLEFSADNGTTWQVLSDSLPRTGSYGWLVPPLNTTQAKFRIGVKGDTLLRDVSNGAFAIESSFIHLASQTVTGPLTGCQNYDVTWTAKATSGFYKVIVSGNGGLTWYPASGLLTYGPTGTFTKTIKVPSLNSTQCLLAVIDPFVNSNRDTTNSTFAISSSTPLLSGISPNGGEHYGFSAPVTITWTTAGSVANVDVSYSDDAGQNWQPIATNIANTGSQAWTTPTTAGASYMVRVQASGDTCLAAQSNATFSISDAGVVDVIFPTGGETFLGGQTQTIRWSASGLTSNNQVKIEFSQDAGNTYTTVATVANTGSYDWTVPSSVTTLGRIRISDAGDAAVSDASASNFTILVNQPPTSNGGPDIYIRLPANAVTINGNGADPEGTPVTFQWSQVSGPSTANLINATTRVLTASPLVQGRYTFRLTVTDNNGGGISQGDNVDVIVLPDTGRARTAWNWVKTGGSTGADRGNHVVSDAAGNAYVVGGFSGSATFGSQALNSAGGMDAFVAKYDSTGTLQWIRTLGNTADDEAYAICLMANGNLAISGFYNLSITTGATTVTSRGSQDCFIASITTDGTWVWLKSGGTVSEDQATGVASVGPDLFVSGWVGNGGGIFGNVSLGNGLGGRDVFAAKYDLNGNAQWVKIIGSSARDHGLGISASAFGALTGFVVTGYVTGDVTLGGNTFPALGGTDAFTVAYQSDGSLAGFRRFGGTGNDVGYSVAIGNDPAQGEAFLRTYVAGSFQYSMSLPGGPTLVSAGSGDAFVVAFDFSGNTPVAVRMGVEGDDAALDLALSNDRLWVTGNLMNKQCPTCPRAFGAQDVFVSRHLFDGTQLQLLQAGGQSVDNGRGIATSVNGSVFASGLFRYSGKFGPLEVAERGLGDFFLGRIGNGPLINFREGEDISWTSAAASAQLAPNPAAPGAEAWLTLTGLPNSNTTAQLTIQDLTGKTLVSRTATVSDGLLSERVNAPLEAGMYLIRVETEGATPVVTRLTVR